MHISATITTIYVKMPMIRLFPRQRTLVPSPPRGRQAPPRAPNKAKGRRGDDDLQAILQVGFARDGSKLSFVYQRYCRNAFSL